MFPVRTEADFEQMLRAAKALAVASAWSALGLFDLLAERPRLPEELPIDQRALRTTVPVLRHMGLIVEDGARVGLSAMGRRMHAAGELPTERSLENLRDQGRMIDVLQNGGPVLDDAGASRGTDGGVVVGDAERTARFLDMLYDMSADSAPSTFGWLAPLLPPGGAMLDLGGGHGRYARTFADAGFASTIFDFAPVIDYSRARHGDRLSYRAGDFRDEAVDFGGPYDLVLLSNIVHGEPADQNLSLISRLARTLGPGGHLVLKDMFLGGQGRDPAQPVFFGLTMLFYTRAGESPDLDAARGWLSSAGLDAIGVMRMDGFELVRGRRPLP